MKRHIDKIKDAHYERGYVYNTNYHIIWVTKYRNQCFTTPELVEEMKEILSKVAELADVQIQEIEVMPELYPYTVQFQAKVQRNRHR